MNKKRLLILADWLDAGAPHAHIIFNMQQWLRLVDEDGMPTMDVGEACGAVCCIAGAAAQFFAPKKTAFAVSDCGRLTYPHYVRDVARVALGLTRSQAFSLFMPDDRVLEDITPQEAGKVVRRLVRTGKVDWRARKTAVQP